MQTQRILPSLLFISLLLFSCKSRNANTNAVSSQQLVSNYDTLIVSPGDAINTVSLTKDFTESITQSFNVSAKNVSVVTGKKGLKIIVDPSKLEKEDGSAVDGKVAVKMIELTNSMDMFRANAATVSDGRLLASGGSYFIDMQCNGQKLILKKGMAMQVNFPLLEDDEMKLFYGERNEENEMNWKEAGVSLVKQYEAISFSDSNRFETNYIPGELDEFKPGHIYRTLDEQVYYYEKKMTLRELVDTINKNSAKVYLQTISFWPKNIPTTGYIDTNYLIANYGPRKQYILRNCKDLKHEEAELERKRKAREEAIKNWQPKSLASRLQKYYAPADIMNLGWINCDRFYQIKEQTDVELDLPITLNDSGVEYFIIYKSFMGLMNDHINVDNESKLILSKLPVGATVTLIAFAKSKGEIYEMKKDFVIEKNKKIIPEIRTISPEEMKDIFAGNVKI